jgi:hypothetical protein
MLLNPTHQKNFKGPLKNEVDRKIFIFDYNDISSTAGTVEIPQQQLGTSLMDNKNIFLGGVGAFKI